ncbi:MAG TPA: cytochrome c [Devosia sp.]|nr:cytochrome c [Devosia sp.]
MIMKTRFALPLAVTLALLAAPALADSAVSFTATQARQGDAVYKDNCAACHGDSLQGALDAPILTGPLFQANWFGKPANVLFDFVSTNMPQDRPGALTPQQYAQVIAFILSKNGVAAGDSPLPSDSATLAGVTLPAPAK